MLKVPEKIDSGFNAFLDKSQIPITHYNYYKKWLRYYLDYCHKYRFDPLNPASLPNFINKLKDKKQTGLQQKQAHESISLFYELIRQGFDLKRFLPSITRHESGNNGKSPRITPGVHSTAEFHKQKLADLNRRLQINKGQTNFSWQTMYDELTDQIKVRHYSPKTLKTYTFWVRKFQYFTKSKNPEALSTSDVKEFLTFLAVEQKVSASSQNLAFNSLLFFFNNALKKDFGKIDGVVRAKKKPRTPIRDS